MVGKTINHYKVLEKIGEGGMGDATPRLLEAVAGGPGGRAQVPKNPDQR